MNKTILLANGIYLLLVYIYVSINKAGLPHTQEIQGNSGNFQLE